MKEPITELRNGQMAVIRFLGEYNFLSSFYDCHIWIERFGRFYFFSSAESIYQAHRATTPEQFESFCELPPSVATAMARKMPHNAHFEQKKIHIMLDCCMRKFTQNEALGQKLLQTEPMPLELHNVVTDDFWGITRHGGYNMLGKCLMLVRAVLQRRLSRGNIEWVAEVLTHEPALDVCLFLPRP